MTRTAAAAALCCVVQGKPSPLLSSFRLSYYTLLNLMKRVEGGTHDLEYVIANSFQQFQQEQAMPKVGELWFQTQCHVFSD
jgi:ATP-dependent RNA helicase DOB1